jgi:hypothetical protein
MLLGSPAAHPPHSGQPQPLLNQLYNLFVRGKSSEFYKTLIVQEGLPSRAEEERVRSATRQTAGCGSSTATRFEWLCSATSAF